MTWFRTKAICAVDRALSRSRMWPPGVNYAWLAALGRTDRSVGTLRSETPLLRSHPETLSLEREVATILALVGGGSTVQDIERHAQLNDALGADDPETLTAAHAVAFALNQSGEHEAALELAEDTLARRRRVLGADHPDTLVTAHNLVFTLNDLGDHEAARLLAEDTLARRRRVLGKDDFRTLRTAETLVSTLVWLGDHNTARSLGGDTLARRRATLGEDHQETIRMAKFLLAIPTD